MAEKTTSAGSRDGPEDTDEMLITRIAAERDRAAFDVLFSRYAGRITNHLIGAGATREEAEEATQEAMASVWRRADSFDPAKAAVSTWMFAIARNRRIDLRRRRARPEPDRNDPSLRPENDPPAETAFSAAERAAALRTALGELGPDQLAVVRLGFYEGESQSAIAEQLDLPLGTVKSRMRLALARLRKVLGDDFARELEEE